jgi:hypothetical protein
MYSCNHKVHDQKVGPAYQEYGTLSIVTYSVVGLNEGVVDGNDLNVRVLHSVTEDDTANTAESVDANLDNHLVCSL